MTIDWQALATLSRTCVQVWMHVIHLGLDPSWRPQSPNGQGSGGKQIPRRDPSSINRGTLQVPLLCLLADQSRLPCRLTSISGFVSQYRPLFALTVQIGNPELPRELGTAFVPCLWSRGRIAANSLAAMHNSIVLLSSAGQGFSLLMDPPRLRE